ncbi:hypothetical protein [Neptuniibacter sp. QD37_11]|uniref:hypothetical protein n=1 Tax=Neptuniibacter sp. QD37_11 TaxID=3398209 RepID=UPI0039F62371
MRYIDALLEDYGITISLEARTSHWGALGELYFMGGEPVFWINPIEPDDKKLWAKAVLLGHFVEHCESGLIQDSSYSLVGVPINSDTEEYRRLEEAQRYANSILKEAAIKEYSK